MFQRHWGLGFAPGTGPGLSIWWACIKDVNPHLRERRVEKHLGETTPSSPGRDSNLSFPILGSLTQQKTSTFANYTTKAETKAINCYTCSSLNGSDVNCEDPYNPAMSTYTEKCMVPKQGHIGMFPANFCIKIVGRNVRRKLRVGNFYGVRTLWPEKFDIVSSISYGPRTYGYGVCIRALSVGSVGEEGRSAPHHPSSPVPGSVQATPPREKACSHCCDVTRLRPCRFLVLQKNETLVVLVQGTACITTVETSHLMVIRACVMKTMDTQCGEFRYQDQTMTGCILTCDYDGCNTAVGRNAPDSLCSLGPLRIRSCGRRKSSSLDLGDILVKDLPSA
uniref:(California timema) hypothetical protein n=1 Tax=Timema californicum TaxID=61474 RepID=A0A7R9P787_TIMCA|nr:unnamed protein product [Timema californicum]